MKEIKLTGIYGRGKSTIVDDEDYLFLSKWKWSSNGKYVCRHITKGSLYLHRFLTDTPVGMVVNHINGNPLDNRKCNLEICTQSENLRKGKTPKTNTSGCKNVSFHKNSGLWRICKSVMGKHISLGYFKTKKEAINKIKALL